MTPSWAGEDWYGNAETRKEVLEAFDQEGTEEGPATPLDN
jgi:hypothetical protein